MYFDLKSHRHLEAIMRIGNRILAGAFCIIFLAGCAATESKQNPAPDDLTAVKAFYEQLLSDPAAPGLEGLVKSLEAFGAVIPDLKWEPQEILRDGNRYIVRSKASGTPVKPFFGVPPAGKRFEIMSIDIHTVDHGKIVHSYHIEEWAQAIRQLKD